nr:hypothetical protein [Tanacetum cinerariifolium]
MISGDTPFDLSFENDIGMGQNGSVVQRLVAAVCLEIMKMFKGKRIVDDNNGTMRNYASTFAHAGASDHMTPHFSLFITTRYLFNPSMVHLPDGRSLKVTIVGEVALTPSLILYDAFYVLEFQLNLLSVGKLIQHKKLTAQFFQNDFMFQDLTTEEIVAVGKGSRCLYICKHMLDPTSFAASIEEFNKSHKIFVPISVFNKTGYSNVANATPSLDVHLFHSRLGHTFVSKLVHIPDCKQFDVSNFHCERSTVSIVWKRRFCELSIFYITFLANVFAQTEPHSYKQAMRDPGWVEAMNKELEALERNNTWELTTLPAGNLILIMLSSMAILMKKYICNKDQFTAVLVYVDDVLITGNCTAEILSLKAALHNKFTIKDLGLAKYFLGIEICRTSAGTYLNQRKYILDLLTDKGLTAAKPKEFPLPTQLKLSHNKENSLKDPGVYRRLVERPLYLTMTRPDIFYAVQHLSQFVSSPKDTHMQAALHLPKY